MSSDFFLNTIVGALTGVITGAYSGFIVARYYEFRALREEVCRIVYSQQTIPDWNHQLLFLSASFNRLGYTAAGTIVTNVIKNLKDSYSVTQESIKEKGLDEHLSNMQLNLDTISSVNKQKNNLKAMKFPTSKIVFPF